MSPVSTATRVKTRCPACKGTVVERRAGWTHGASSWFYCFFCNHTWKSRVDDARAHPDGELTGSVNVVLRRKKKHPLGFVVLHAIPEEDLKKHLERRAGQRESKLAKLQREIDAVAPTLAQAQAEEDRLWNIQKQDESNLGKAKAWSAAFNRTKEITRQLDDLLMRRQRLTSGELFLQDLPSAISSATTNADGSFTLPLPRDGRYGVVARADREPGEDGQPYVWFVWVTLDGEPTKRLVLNNDNVVGSGSPDSALP